MIPITWVIMNGVITIIERIKAHRLSLGQAGRWDHTKCHSCPFPVTLVLCRRDNSERNPSRSRHGNLLTPYVSKAANWAASKSVWASGQTLSSACETAGLGRTSQTQFHTHLRNALSVGFKRNPGSWCGNSALGNFHLQN